MDLVTVYIRYGKALFIVIYSNTLWMDLLGFRFSVSVFPFHNDVSDPLVSTNSCILVAIDFPSIHCEAVSAFGDFTLIRHQFHFRNKWKKFSFFSFLYFISCKRRIKFLILAFFLWLVDWQPPEKQTPIWIIQSLRMKMGGWKTTKQEQICWI